VRGDALGKADDCLAARVAAKEQAGEQRQKRHYRQQEGAELGHGDPG
jgi:hypothetical protein